MLNSVPSASSTSTMIGLRCRECGHTYPKVAVHVCEFCFGPLEVAYDYDLIARRISQKSIMEGPPSLWRYRDLLPVEGEPTVGLHSGFTPLIRARNLGRALGHNELYVKNDAVCHPTLSFKDRVVSVALTRARELGFETVACASTGNLANATAAHAAQAGLKSYVLIPYDLEAAKVYGTQLYGSQVVKIDGTYDDVNRLCSEITGRHPWAFVNVNIRPYYAEGSKSFGFEIQEQLGWKTPAHFVVPMASGSLLTKIAKSIEEFSKLGLIESRGPVKFHGAQAAGCGPISEAVLAGRTAIKPVKTPATIAKSLAIGNPADGPYAAQAILQSGGSAARVSDEEIVSAIRLLAETEGVFAETAGGVTLASFQQLLRTGAIQSDEPTVLCITGQGLKTQDAVFTTLPDLQKIPPRIDAFEQLLRTQKE